MDKNTEQNKATAAGNAPREESEIESLTRQLMQAREFIADLGAFIRFAANNDKSAEWTLSNIAHDVNGAHMEGLDSFFSPRVSGYAKRERSKRQ